MRNEVIYLISEVEPEYDSDGFQVVENKTKVKVFAEVKSTNYKEYYEASRNGENATDIFVVDERDYKASIMDVNGKKVKPQFVVYEDTEYRIIRRYKKGTNGDFVIELTCEEVE